MTSGAPGSTPFRVLLVEDNRGDSILIGEALRDVQDGIYVMDRAGSLAEGLALAAASQFDAILLDLGLPDSQGIQTLTAMLAVSAAPVLVITGLADEELGLEAIHQGAQDYLVKGRTSDEVLRRSLRYAIERARLRAATTSPLIETAPVGLAVLDRDLRYLYVNPAMAEINGLPPLAHLGHRFDRVATEQTLDAIELLEKVIESGEPVRELEIEGRRKGGRDTSAWLLNAEPLRDASGATVGLTASLVEITERKHKEEALAALAESRSQAQAIGESLPYGIWICGADGGLRYASPSFLELLGMDLGQAGGLGWTRVMSKGAAELMLEAWDACRANEAQWEYELAVQGSDGRHHTILSRGGPIRDEAGRVTSWAGINLDITERKEAEAFRDAFVGVLSHELRTPITSINAAATLLRKRSIGREERAELVVDIGEEAERLRRLVANLLVLARSERGGLCVEAEPLVLAHLARRVIEEERRLWGKRFELAVAEPVPVAAGDEALVSQVLGNLVSNAAKYGPSDGAVEVLIDAPDGKPRIRVLDRGPGIEPDEAERLFELFYRSPRTARVSGSGIGLFVARQLVEAMGGRIWARPRQDPPGSEFGFDLQPFADEPV